MDPHDVHSMMPDEAMGDDCELIRRIEAWKAERVSISAEEMHAELRALSEE